MHAFVNTAGTSVRAGRKRGALARGFNRNAGVLSLAGFACETGRRPPAGRMTSRRVTAARIKSLDGPICILANHHTVVALLSGSLSGAGLPSWWDWSGVRAVVSFDGTVGVLFHGDVAKLLREDWKRQTRANKRKTHAGNR